MSGFALFGMIVAAIIVLTILVIVVADLPDLKRYLHILNMSKGWSNRVEK